MCLNIFDEILTKKFQNRKKTIVGYKIVNKHGLKCYTLLYERGISFKIGKNISTETEISTFNNENIFYPSGFHCFTSLKSASKYVIGFDIIKVFINPKDIVAVGIESGFKVIVSKKITIKSFKDVRKK
jgi:hypothetical protein